MREKERDSYRAKIKEKVGRRWVKTGRQTGKQRIKGGLVVI